MAYIISFFAVAVFPLALAALGGHLAALVLDGKKKRNMLFLVWLLAILGVLAAVGQQVYSFRSDSVRDRDQASMQVKQNAMQADLQTSLQQQAYTKGQLQSISLMVGNISERSADPVLKQFADVLNQIAKAKTPATEFVRKDVVALIRDLRTFQSKRQKLEHAFDGTIQGQAVDDETRGLFQQRFTDRLRRLAAELPQYLSAESGQLAEPAMLGGDFIEPIIETLLKVSASL
jgi:hypothetical protein